MSFRFEGLSFGFSTSNSGICEAQVAARCVFGNCLETISGLLNLQLQSRGIGYLEISENIGEYMIGLAF
jgi:hypothetical protein